jgi:hypothetical protein
LVVESELTSTNEYPVVIYVAEIQPKEAVGDITSAPGTTDVAANVKSSPTERGGV